VEADLGEVQVLEAQGDVADERRVELLVQGHVLVVDDVLKLVS
jgi:hypothetical protein